MFHLLVITFNPKDIRFPLLRDFERERRREDNLRIVHLATDSSSDLFREGSNRGWRKNGGRRRSGVGWISPSLRFAIPSYFAEATREGQGVSKVVSPRRRRINGFRNGSRGLGTGGARGRGALKPQRKITSGKKRHFKRHGHV